MMCTPRILSVALSDTNLTRPSVSDTDRARLLAMNENLPTCARGGPARARPGRGRRPLRALRMRYGMLLSEELQELAR